MTYPENLTPEEIRWAKREYLKLMLDGLNAGTLDMWDGGESLLKIVAKMLVARREAADANH